MNAIPLRVQPQEDEAWHSYLVRTAARNRCSLGELASHVGLLEARGRWPGYHGVILSDARAAGVSRALGLTPQQVQRMQLARYDQLALDVRGLAAGEGIAGTRATVQSAWVWMAGSTFCPDCLSETDGAWRVSWRLPWITTCLIHSLHLVGRCATCGAVPGLGNQFHTSAPTRLRVVPDGRRCPHPEPGGDTCGADLSAVDRVAAETARLTRTQHFIGLAAGERGLVAGAAYTSLQTLRAWQSAIGIATRLGAVDAAEWGRTHRWANPPRDPDLVDRLLLAVQPLVSAPTTEEAADVLSGWCDRAGIRSPHADTFAKITQPSAALQPVIDELLGRRGRAHTLIQRRLTRPDGTDIGVTNWDIDDLPQLVWPCALPVHLQQHKRPDQRILRAVIALILARLRGDYPDWPAAGASLGVPSAKARTWTRYAFSDRWGLKGSLLHAAEHLQALLPEQIDRHAWRDRATLEGHGLVAIRWAQQPSCRLQDATNRWCPCTATIPRRNP